MQIVRLSSDDFEAARQIVAWLAYPDRPHMRERERKRAAFRAKAMTWQHYYWQREKGMVPKYDGGRIVERSRINNQMFKIDTNVRRALWASEMQTASGGTPIIALGNFTELPTGAIQFAASAPFNYFANTGENVKSRRSTGQWGSEEKTQQRTAIERYFEPYKQIMHLARGVSRLWPVMMRFDPIHGDRFERENRPLTRLICYPDWIEEALVTAEKWKNLPVQSGFNGPLIQFER
jgi:hypothetical protein